jgi:hypothetical protein
VLVEIFSYAHYKEGVQHTWYSLNMQARLILSLKSYFNKVQSTYITNLGVGPIPSGFYFTTMLRHGSFSNYFNLVNDIIAKERNDIQHQKDDRAAKLDKSRLSEVLCGEYRDEGLTLYKFMEYHGFDFIDHADL